MYLVFSKLFLSFYVVNMSGVYFILVFWELVLEGFLYGIFLGYCIFYIVISIVGEDVRKLILNMIIMVIVLRIILSDLLNYVVYEIKVIVFIVKGGGVISYSIIVGLFNYR